MNKTTLLFALLTLLGMFICRAALKRCCHEVAAKQNSGFGALLGNKGLPTNSRN